MIQDGIEGHAKFAAEPNPLEGSANLWVHTSINKIIDAVIRGNLPVSSFVLGRHQLKQTGDSASMRFLFAFFRVNEHYRDFSLIDEVGPG